MTKEFLDFGHNFYARAPTNIDRQRFRFSPPSLSYPMWGCFINFRNSQEQNLITSVTHLLIVHYNMSNTPTRLYYETIERGNIVNKDTFDGIREDIESAIAAGQKEAIANTNISSYAIHKKTSGQSRLPKIEEDLNERGHWGSKAEFILSCVGFSVS